MARFAEAKFTIRAINKTQKAFAEINNNVSNMDRRFSKLGRGLQRIGGLMATAFVGRQLVDTITKFEKLEASLRTVTGSADKAAVAFGFIQDFAATTPFQLEEVTDAFSKLVKAIGDAGLTDILMAVANAIKWLAEKITAAIPLFKLGFKAIVAEVIKFGNLFIAVFKGVGRAFQAFGETISARFEALGKDLAAFIENPLGGVSFENTRAALETGLLDAMGSAFDQALTEAREFNAAIDAEIQGAALKMAEARQAKNASLASLFEETQTPEKTEETSKATEKFTKLQREAQRIIESTRTPLERYNKEMELLNKLLKEGHINQETFGRAMEQAQERLQKSSEKVGDVIEGEFADLGKTMEGSIADSLDAINGRFDSFGDFAKGFLSDLNRSLLQFALKDLGITGKSPLGQQIH